MFSKPTDGGLRAPRHSQATRICIAFTLIGMEPPSGPNGSTRRPIGGSVALGDRLPSDGHFEWLASCVSRKSLGHGRAFSPEDPTASALSTWPDAPSRIARFDLAFSTHMDFSTGKSGTVVT
jgi:hypothetical protein